jgi:signal transduction histidine kinase
MNFILWPHYKLHFVIAFILISNISKAQLITYDETDYSILKKPQLLIADSLLFDNVQSLAGNFKDIESNTINLMYQQKNCWIRTQFIALHGINDASFSINYPLLCEAKFYSISPHGIDSSIIHINDPIEKRSVISQNFVHLLPPIYTGDTITVYINVNGELPIMLPLELNQQKEYISKSNLNNIIIAIYFGIMLSLFLYNLFVYVSVKDRNYLYYVIYILFITIAQLGLLGFLIRYSLPNGSYNTAIIIIASVISGMSAIKFSSKFISLREYAPRFYGGLYFFYAGYILAFLFFFTGKHLLSFHTLDALGITVSLYALAFSIYVSLKGYRPAKFFLIAWIFFILGLIIFVLRSNGVLSTNIITSSALLWGSSLEALLLSFALADKINIYRKEKELSQAQALAIAKENEKIIREQNITLEQKVTERTVELRSTNDELNKTLFDLKETQTQLVESEKMASLGQLTAGIAHEINNPINFVTSNIKPLKRDVDILLELITKIEEIASTGIEAAEKEKQIEELKLQYDFDYLKEEITFLLKGINEGSNRTAEIVKGLRIFSRVDEDDLKKADINEGIDSTLIIMNNQLNGRIIINKKYGNIPLIECYPGKLNQVFLNLISNSIYAINAKYNQQNGGEITITTLINDLNLQIIIADNGIGMTESTLKKLFEPFYTTKPLGEGTGLGLSISYNTIKKHRGTISVISKVNVGTTFTIEIPIINTNS